MIVVFQVAGWEIQCCQPAPRVGERVSWPLQWLAGAGWPGSTSMRWDRVEAAPSSEGFAGWLLARQGLHAWCRATGALVPGVGYLLGDAHRGAPDLLPETTGVVERVQVVSQGYAQTRPLEWTPLAHHHQLRDAPPESFDFLNAAVRRDGRLRYEDDALLVQLRVDQ